MRKLIHYFTTAFAISLIFACAGPPEQKPIQSRLFNYQILTTPQGHKLHLAKSGNPTGTPIVMIHGTPGSWDSYSDLMQNAMMQKNYAMHSIDRLGWGKSISANNKIETSFKPHTDSIDTLLKHIYQQTQKKSIVIGHSLGGSLAPMVAIESAAYIKGIIIIAGDIDPKFGEPRWYNALADLWLIKQILPAALAKANDEIMPLKQELTIMNARLNEIDIPTTLIHGTKDNLVNYKNVAYAKNALKHLQDKLNIVSIEGAGHFVIWKHIPVIIKSINKINKAS